jgi:integral membrane protein
MISLLKTDVGCFRLLGWLEGSSLIALLTIAVPVKYLLHNPTPVQWLGPVHGALVLLFLCSALQAGITHRWSFRKQAWKVLVACLIPFGTFYIDRRLLRPLANPS